MAKKSPKPPAGIEPAKWEEMTKSVHGRMWLKRLHIHPKKKQVDRALEELITAIESWLIDAGLAFEDGGISGGLPGSDVLSRLEASFDPRLILDRTILNDAFNKLPADFSQACDEALTSLEGSLREVYFFAGMLMGARIRGAQKDELRKIGERWPVG